MLIACWSAKGGSGTTVVSVALSLLIARRVAGPIVLADLAGDVPATLGIAEPAGPGLGEWLRAGPEVPPAGLSRLEVEGATNLRVLPRGDGGAVGEAGDAAGERLAVALAGAGPVVVDCGLLQSEASLAVARNAGLSLLVLRPCYLALRKALAAPLRPSAVVLVDEGERALSPADVEDVLGVPVRARVPWHPAIARAVDAGLLADRVPLPLARALRAAA